MNDGRDIILVVDDDLAVRESLKFSLELEGFTVHACGGGAELLRHPALTRAGCLVLDYKMPVMDGFQVLDRLSAADVHIPVILITSNADTAFRNRAERLGVHCVLEKPLSDSMLLEDIRSLLNTPQ